MAMNPGIQTTGRDRRMYIWFAVLMAIIVLAGFARSYYLKGFFGLTDLCLLACVAYDSVKNRRLHPAFLWGTLLIIASQPLRLMLSGTDIWLRFATMLVGLMK